MTEATKTSGALAAFMRGGQMATLDAKAQAAALMASAETGRTGSGGDALYLSFSGKLSKYSLGRDKDDVDPEDCFVVDPTSMIEGWTCWKGGSVAEKHEWAIADRATQAIPADRLKDHGPYGDGDGWSFMMGFSMFNADDPETRIIFSTTSVSGRNVLADLNKEIAVRLLAAEPHVPVIRLSSEQFTSKGKTNGKPKLIFEGWVTPPEVMAYIGMGDDGDLDDLIAGNYAGAATEAAPEPEQEAAPEPEATAPKRRARRSAAA